MPLPQVYQLPVYLAELVLHHHLQFQLHNILIQLPLLVMAMVFGEFIPGHMVFLCLMPETAVMEAG
ncbi:hypothetical protein D3C85_1377970 [compost metagenome]